MRYENFRTPKMPVAKSNGTFILVPTGLKLRGKALSKHKKNKRIRLERRQREGAQDDWRR